MKHRAAVFGGNNRIGGRFATQDRHFAKTGAAFQSRKRAVMAIGQNLAANDNASALQDAEAVAFDSTLEDDFASIVFANLRI